MTNRLSYDPDPVISGGTGTSSTQVQGAAADDAAAVGNPVLAGGVYESTPETYDNGDAARLHVGQRGSLRVELAVQDSASAVRCGVDNADAAVVSSLAANLIVMARGTVFNGTTWDRVRKPNATSRIVSAAADTNATSAKASAGDLFQVSGYNASGALRYLKFYNKASAPTVGTDTPVLTYALPPGGFVFDMQSLYFATGIAYALTTGSADADTGALTAGDIVGLNVVYV